MSKNFAFSSLTNTYSAKQLEIDNLIVNDITVEGTAIIPGTGEANTASNSGTGSGLVQAKVGVDLPFKSLVGGTNITLTGDANHIQIDNDNSPFDPSAQLALTNATSSTNTSTGALTVAGGVGIGENLNVGGDVNVTGTSFKVNNFNVIGQSAQDFEIRNKIRLSGQTEEEIISNKDMRGFDLINTNDKSPTLPTITNGFTIASASCYIGCIYAPTQKRVYYVPFGSSSASNWHYLDEFGVLHEYTHGFGTSIPAGLYEDAIYVPDNQRIYFLPRIGSAGSSTTWHYIDVSNPNQVDDTAVVIAYTHGSDVTGNVDYIGGAYHQASKRIYLAPYNRTGSVGHYINILDNTVGTYPFTLPGGGAYIGASYVPENRQVIFHSNNRTTTWHYIDADLTLKTYSAPANSHANRNGAFSPIDKRVYLAPFGGSTAGNNLVYVDVSTTTPSAIIYDTITLVANDYTGVIRDPVNNRMYFSPYGISNSANWHYVEVDEALDANKIKTYANGLSIPTLAYRNGCYFPDLEGLILSPSSVCIIATWNYISTQLITNKLTMKVDKTIATDYTIIWPSAQASGTQVLENDGAGNLSWATNAGGDVTGPAGGTANNEIAVYSDTTGKVVKSSGVFITTPATDSMIITDITPINALGTDNLFIGNEAGLNLTALADDRNTMIGSNAGKTFTAGTKDCVSIGAFSGGNGINLRGTYVGRQATGAGNRDDVTAIGYLSQASHNNSSAIGSGSITTATNQCQLGNSSVTQVGVGTMKITTSGASAGLVLTASSGTASTWATPEVTLVGAETLTNKTLTAPVISTISNTGTLTLPTSTDTLVGRNTTEVLTNKTFDDTTTKLRNTADPTKQIVTNVNSSQPTLSTISIIYPSITDQLVGRASSDALTNKIISSTTNNVVARSLHSATTIVTVNTTTPTTGQYLKATSGTAATWQNLEQDNQRALATALTSLTGTTTPTLINSMTITTSNTSNKVYRVSFDATFGCVTKEITTFQIRVGGVVKHTRKIYLEKVGSITSFPTPFCMNWLTDSIGNGVVIEVYWFPTSAGNTIELTDRLLSITSVS